MRNSLSQHSFSTTRRTMHKNTSWRLNTDLWKSSSNIRSLWQINNLQRPDMKEKNTCYQINKETNQTITKERKTILMHYTTWLQNTKKKLDSSCIFTCWYNSKCVSGSSTASRISCFCVSIPPISAYYKNSRSKIDIKIYIEKSCISVNKNYNKDEIVSW